ncbi:hypothetical protein [Pseudarthrobacter sp. SSS035]|uniref:hypothetical protein n=1 Tax=Pseudarthrobacter sp. SSS035 TaxID=2931399 RepID=UPI00200CC372|nr:hypothetical protein [Pseudarthrobacter sp. SSS035]
MPRIPFLWKVSAAVGFSADPGQGVLSTFSGITALDFPVTARVAELGHFDMDTPRFEPFRGRVTVKVAHDGAPLTANAAL